MQKLIVGAVVVALCGAPAISRAESPGALRQVGASPRNYVELDRAPSSSPERDAAATDESEYASREKAAPQQLAKFSGGDNGVYITTGALLVAVLIVLLITRL